MAGWSQTKPPSGATSPRLIFTNHPRTGASWNHPGGAAGGRPSQDGPVHPPDKACRRRHTIRGMIRAVVFDVGECLVDEAREYGSWADRLGVPRHTFAAMSGAVIAQGRDYRDVFQEFEPEFDLSEQREARAVAGQPERFDESDLYPDVRPALAALREAGLWLGIAGNQTVRVGGILRKLFTRDVDLLGTLDDWGGSKPDPEFFVRVAEAVPHTPGEILCVGDRIDNDLKPAVAAGMPTALIRRGPWETIRWGTDEAKTPSTFRVEVTPRSRISTEPIGARDSTWVLAASTPTDNTNAPEGAPR